MRTIEKHTFVIDPSYAKPFRVIPWLGLALVAFFIAAPFLPHGGQNSDLYGMSVLSWFGAICFGIITWYLLRFIKQLPFASITIDSDGLWPAHVPKENGLVPWESIAAIRERRFHQRLDVKNDKGDVVLKVEYQLDGFYNLRALLIESLVDNQQLLAMPATFSKPARYHILNVACLIGFLLLLLLGVYVGASIPLTSIPLIVYIIGCGFIVIIVWKGGREYLTTVSAVEAGTTRVKVRFPLRHREFSYTEIESVRLGDLFAGGMMHPEVGIFLKGAHKPIRLAGLGADATTVYLTISGLKKRYG